MKAVWWTPASDDGSIPGWLDAFARGSGDPRAARNIRLGEIDRRRGRRRDRARRRPRRLSRAVRAARRLARDTGSSATRRGADSAQPFPRRTGYFGNMLSASSCATRAAASGVWDRSAFDGAALDESPDLLSHFRMIDGIDASILTILQANSRTSNAEIARQVGLAASAVFERIRKLEERGVIRGYRAEIEPKSLDLGQLAFIFIRSNDRPGVADTPARLPRSRRSWKPPRRGRGLLSRQGAGPGRGGPRSPPPRPAERNPIDHLDPHDDRPRVGQTDRLASRRARRRRRKGVAWLTHPSTDLPPEC